MLIVRILELVFFSVKNRSFFKGLEFYLKIEGRWILTSFFNIVILLFFFEDSL